MTAAMPPVERWDNYSFPLGAGAKAIAGAAACFDTASDGNQGYVIPGTSQTWSNFVGFFDAGVDNTAGVAGALSAKVNFPLERTFSWFINDGSISTVSVGQTSSLLASGPIATLTTGHTALGRIIAVDAVKGVLVEVSQ